MTLSFLPLTVIIPAIGAVAASQDLDRDRGRRVAVAAVLGQLVCALVLISTWKEGVGPFLATRLGPWALAVDGLAAAFLPLVPIIALGVVLIGPRRRLDPGYLGAVLLTAAASAGLILAADLGTLVAFWVASLLPNYAMLNRHSSAFIRDELRRSYAVYLFGGALPICGAVAMIGPATPVGLDLVGDLAVDPSVQGLAFAGIAAAVIIRMGVFPAHSWLPLHIEHGPLGIGVMTVSTHVAVYVLARAIPILPVGADEWMPWLSYVAVGSGVFGSALAVVQTNLRRAIAFLVVSQSSLMLLGLSSMTEPSVQGAVIQAVASGGAVGGLLLLVWALEARTGTADFTRFGGFAQTMPRMATVFFVFSAAAVGFPGSLMFIAEDLIVHGVLDEHPLIAGAVLLAMASNGYMLVRAFSRIFLGPSEEVGGDGAVGESADALRDLLGRERIVAGALGLIIVGGGIHPQPLITLSHDAALALALHHERHEPLGTPPHDEASEGHHPEVR